MPDYTPNEYQTKLSNIKSVFSSLKKDFDDLPDDQESDNSGYIKQEEELTILQNDLMRDMDTILGAVDRENVAITEYDTNNEILNARYIDIKDKIYGAIGMKNDTQTLYNHEYYGNILIFSSILGGCLLYARTRNL
jgi:Zn-dependent oligopeptidase